MVYAYKSINKNFLNNKVQSLFKKKNQSKYNYITSNTITEEVYDNTMQTLSVNSIIKGYFPKENIVKEMAIKKVNRSLGVILGIFIAVVMISYYFVVSCELKLNDLSRQTVILNNENEELQNKLDTLKSFSNVDQTLQNNNMQLGTGQVIEAPEIVVDTENTKNKKKKRLPFKYAIGF